MSKIVGHMLLNAAIVAGHDELVGFETAYDIGAEDILVRLYTYDHKKCVDFCIPDSLFDPVEYAQAKWPEWFAKKRSNGSI